MTTAAIYRKKEANALVQTARYIFNVLLKNEDLVPLGDLLDDIKTGKTPSKQEKRFYEDSYIDWFKPEEIGSTKYLLRAKEHLSKYAFDKKQVTEYEPGTILINAIGDVGRIVILNHKASSNQQITGVKANKEKLNVEYLYYYLLSNRHLFYKDLFKTTLPVVSQKKILQLVIKLPSIKVQCRIVDFLSKLESVTTIDDLNKLIDYTEYIDIAKKYYKISSCSSDLNFRYTHQLDLVKQLRQSFLREAMQGKLVPQDPNDEPASVLLEKIKAEKERLIKEKKIRKDKPLPPITKDEIPYELPVGWVWCRLGEIIITAKDGPHFSPQYSKEGIPFISTRNISPNGIDFSTSKFISNDYHNEISRRCKPEKWDVLYTKGGTTGIATVNTCDFEFNVWVHVAVLKMTRYMNSFYLRNCLNSPHCYKQSQNLTKGISNQDLGLTRMVTITLALPPLSEQHRIVAKLDQLMQYCDQLEAGIRQSQQHNEQLLQQVLREALDG